MKNCRTRLMISATTCLLAAAAPAEFVDLRTEVLTNTEGLTTNGFYGTAPDLTNGPATCVTAVLSNNAAAQATFGLARVHVFARDGGRAYAYAGWEDEMTIVPDDGSLDGQSANVSCQLNFTGKIARVSGSIDCDVQYAYRASLAGGTYGPAFGQWSSSGGYSGFPLGGETNYGFGCTFGVPFSIGAYLWLDAHAGDGIGAVDANFGRWAQSILINSINGPSGLVTGYTVVASSGLSWRGPYLSPPAEVSGLGIGDGTVSVGVDNLVVGFTNVLEASTGVGSAGWTRVADCSWAGGDTTVVIQAGSTTSLFFRLRSQ